MDAHPKNKNNFLELLIGLFYMNQLFERCIKYIVKAIFQTNKLIHIQYIETPQETWPLPPWDVTHEVMLCGRYPFDGQKQPLDDQIRTASYCMSGRIHGKCFSTHPELEHTTGCKPETQQAVSRESFHHWRTGDGVGCGNLPGQGGLVDFSGRLRNILFRKNGRMQRDFQDVGWFVEFAI